jgi:4-carboxymuconolactone decarboxylase
MDERERYRRGLAVRREVLGDEHVDRALGARSELDADFQDLITRYAWGEVWARPGIPRKTRSLLTLALLVALGRDDELRMHLRAARRIGVTRETIAEVLLQTAIYCGVPAANAALHLAAEVLAEEGRDRAKPAPKRGLRTRKARR